MSETPPEALSQHSNNDGHSSPSESTSDSVFMELDSQEYPSFLIRKLKELVEKRKEKMEKIETVSVNLNPCQPCCKNNHSLAIINESVPITSVESPKSSSLDETKLKSNKTMN